MKVWVVWDPLSEKVNCVHSQSGMTCPDCEGQIIVKDRSAYHLEEIEKEVQFSKQEKRDIKIDKLLNE